MITGAWSNSFTNQSLFDIDESSAIGRQLGDLEMSDVSSVVGDYFSSLSQSNVTNKSHDIQRPSTHREIANQSTGSQLWDPNIPFQSLYRKSTSSNKITLVHNQRATPLLQRGLVFFHMGRWSESATTSIQRTRSTTTFIMTNI